MKALRLLAALLLALVAGPALAQTWNTNSPNPTVVNVPVVCPNPATGVVGGCGSTAPSGNNYDAPFAGAVAFVLDTPQAVQRSIGANCTVAGNVALTFGDATTITVPVGVGWQTFPFGITTVNTSGTTATCTYSNLK